MSDNALDRLCCGTSILLQDGGLCGLLDSASVSSLELAQSHNGTLVIRSRGNGHGLSGLGSGRVLEAVLVVQVTGFAGERETRVGHLDLEGRGVAGDLP